MTPRFIHVLADKQLFIPYQAQCQRLGTIIAVISSGTDFVNTPHRNSTNYVRDEARTSQRLLDRQTP